MNFKISVHVYHHGVTFSNLVFSSVALIESMCIFASQSSLTPSNSFSMLFIHSAFLLCSLRPNIFLQICLLFLSSGCSYVFVHSSPRLVGFFSLFHKVLFCLDCLILSSFFRLNLFICFLVLYCLFYLLYCFSSQNSTVFFLSYHFWLWSFISYLCF